MRALIISVDLGSPDHAAHAEEFDMLARGAGAEIVDTVKVRRDRPDANYYIQQRAFIDVLQIHHETPAKPSRQVAVRKFQKPGALVWNFDSGDDRCGRNDVRKCVDHAGHCKRISCI